MLFAVLAWAHVRRTAQANDELRAQNEAQRVIDAIQDRINGHIGLLRACAGFFAANDEVTRDGFRRMVERVSVARFYPGTVGVGFSIRVEHDARDELVLRMRQDIPDFEVWPHVSRDEAAEAAERLREVRTQVREVAPLEAVRTRAMRLLSAHALRTADSLQLAASLIWCEEQPASETFVSLDERLRDAARREGFTLLPEV